MSTHKDSEAMELYWTTHANCYNVFSAKSLGDGAWSVEDVFNELDGYVFVVHIVCRRIFFITASSIKVGSAHPAASTRRLNSCGLPLVSLAHSGLWEGRFSDLQFEEIVNTLVHSESTAASCSLIFSIACKIFVQQRQT